MRGVGDHLRLNPPPRHHLRLLRHDAGIKLVPMLHLRLFRFYYWMDGCNYPLKTSYKVIEKPYKAL